MAHDAFALSPISARAAEPSEADYGAICEAFMETARGRWFLSEYARRNRNADTRLVLDAVARIEASLERQKKAAAPPPDVAPHLAAALSETRQRVLAALAHDDAALAQDTVRKGARVIRDVAWTLRECGADVRICDLLDTQVAAINAGCDRQTALAAPHAAISALFDDLDATLQALLRGEASPSSATAAQPAAQTENAAPPPVNEIAVDVFSADDPAADFPTAEHITTADDHAAAIDASVMPAAAPVAETIAAPSNAALDDMAEPPAPVTAYAEASPSSAMPAVAADWREQPSSADIVPSSANIVEDAAPPPAVSLSATPLSATPVPATPVSAPAQSLGAAILRSGLIDRALPEHPRSDPFAPLRKLSQAEKIALFS